jgi:hypothetical protein
MIFVQQVEAEPIPAQFACWHADSCTSVFPVKGAAKKHSITARHYRCTADCKGCRLVEEMQLKKQKSKSNLRIHGSNWLTLAKKNGNINFNTLGKRKRAISQQTEKKRLAETIELIQQVNAVPKWTVSNLYI